MKKLTTATSLMIGLLVAAFLLMGALSWVRLAYNDPGWADALQAVGTFFIIVVAATSVIVGLKNAEAASDAAVQGKRTADAATEQARIATEQLALLRQEMTTMLRPYLGVGTPEPSSITPDMLIPWAWRVRVENYGAIPAEIRRLNVVWAEPNGQVQLTGGSANGFLGGPIMGSMLPKQAEYLVVEPYHDGSWPETPETGMLFIDYEYGPPGEPATRYRICRTFQRLPVGWKLNAESTTVVG